MNELETRLANLSDTQLVETATLYLSEDVGYKNTDALGVQLAGDVKAHGGESATLFELLGRIQQDHVAFRYLLQDVLGRAARGTDAEQARLRVALDGIDQNQIALELLFAIYAASVVTMVWLGNPPTKVTRTTTTTIDPDGKIKIVETEKTEEAPPPIKELYGWIAGLFGKSGKSGKAGS